MVDKGMVLCLDNLAQSRGAVTRPPSQSLPLTREVAKGRFDGGRES